MPNTLELPKLLRCRRRWKLLSESELRRRGRGIDFPLCGGGGRKGDFYHHLHVTCRQQTACGCRSHDNK